MKAVPETKAGEIIDRANEFARAGGPFASADDFWWRVLKRQAEQIIPVDPGKGWSTYGTLMSLVGNSDEMERGFKAALPFAGQYPEIITNHMVVKSNLGFFSEALEQAQTNAAPESGFFTERFHILIHSGGFDTAAQHLKKAKAMGIDLSGLTTASKVELAASLLRRANLSDSDVAAHLDLAGGLLRDRKHLFVGQPVVDAQDMDGVFTGVTYTLKLRMSRIEVFEMNCALAKAEADAGVKRHPYFDVTFAAALTSEPSQLLECAERIAKISDDDATFRAAVSRGYYAAYHAAKRFHESLAKPGFVMGARGRHQQLLNQLAYPDLSPKNDRHTVSVALSKTLRPVYAARVDADYHLHLPITKELADTTLSACREVLDVSDKWVSRKVA